MANLRKQFDQALTNIQVSGQKRQRTIDAHTEIRELLQGDEQLKDWGAKPLLIGSYGRETGIYPGKDVDVLLRLADLNTDAEPRKVYNEVWRVLLGKYGQYGQGKGRAQQRNRSIKVHFPDRKGLSGSRENFAVDVVPAVRDGNYWAIPTHDQNEWAGEDGRWIRTAAVQFGDLSTALNQAQTTPKVGDGAAYKLIVKLVRQIRETHLGDSKPGGLYMEFVTYEAWNTHRVSGKEWDTLLAGTLKYVADHFANASVKPLLDPVLGTPYDPPLTDGQIKQAAEEFGRRAGDANRALTMNDYDAAVAWQKILGSNDRTKPEPVLPLPQKPGSGAGGMGTGAVGGGGAGGAGIARPNEATRFG